MKNTIDLHNHTIASLDGSYTPEQLVDIAINSNIKVFAISDHDVISSLKPAQDYVKDKNITFIPAVELSVDLHGILLHILSYGIDFNDSRYLSRQTYYQNSVIDYGKSLIAKTLEFGFKFDPEIVYGYRKDHLVCEELVAKAIFEDSRNDNDERLIEFRPGGQLSDNPRFNFYKKFCVPGAPLNIPYNFNMPIEQAAELIHSTNGKMFLAHPNHNIKHDNVLFEEIMSYGLDGIEVFSSYHSPQDIEFYYDKAKKNNLYMSVGSDFHGDSKPAIKMGSINYDETELNKTIDFILNK